VGLPDLGVWLDLPRPQFGGRGQQARGARRAGHKPSCATRSFAVLCTGFLAGLGGAYMANVGAGLFVPFMTGGAGVIGIVLAMLAPDGHCGY